MRKRIEILDDTAKTDMLILEVLIDIRDVLCKKQKRVKNAIHKRPA